MPLAVLHLPSLRKYTMGQLRSIHGVDLDLVVGVLDDLNGHGVVSPVDVLIIRGSSPAGAMVTVSSLTTGGGTEGVYGLRSLFLITINASLLYFTVPLFGFQRVPSPQSHILVNQQSQC